MSSLYAAGTCRGSRPGAMKTASPRSVNAAAHGLRAIHARAALDRLGLEQCDMVGNSVGAYVAARLALDQPERVRHLVLVSSSTLAPPLASAS